MTKDFYHKEWYQWRDEALRQVRFTPDHDAIAKELYAHYEDHVRDLERIGYERKLAEERALLAMGDAEEVGRGLDRAHSPALGWLWQASRVLMVLMIVLALVLGIMKQQWTELENAVFFADHETYWDYGYVGASEENRHEYTLVDEVFLHWEEEYCGYDLSVPYAALWVRPMTDGTPIYYLTVVLISEDLRFWDEAPYLTPMTISTDWGKTWYAVGMGEELPQPVSYFNSHTVEKMPFHSTRILSACLNQVHTQWVELNYNGSESWNLRIQWEEGIYD
ncbi:MAG: hypothetical protein PUC45_08205 [Oscillospiraceae bacterium]|nr:hypothetical protein [Oscillospiraceae bacterium]